MSFVIHHPDLDTDKVVPEHTLATYARKGWVLTDRFEPGTTPAAPKLAMPNRSASAAAWKTYAVVNGMNFDEAMAMTRDELADKYDPAPNPIPAAPAPKAELSAKTPKES